MRLRLAAHLLALAAIGAALAGPASAKAPGGDALFVHAGESGTVKNGRLTLRGVSRQLTWFTDRPERDSGSVSFGTYKKALFGGKVAPNAALDIAGSDLDGVAAVRLTDPRFNKRKGRVSYRIKRLKQVSGNLDHYKGRVSKQRLPESFGAASLFIDGAFGNYCYTTIVNATGYGLLTGTSSKWSSDDWDPALPSDFGMGNGSSWSWGSQGGAFRGCSNSATWDLYAGASGTFSFQTTDPWKGKNTITCTSSNPAFRCLQVSLDGGEVTWSLGPTPP